MTVLARSSREIVVDDTTTIEAQSFRASSAGLNASLVLKDSDGRELPLPQHVQAVLLQTIESLASNEAVAIGTIPDELTSVTAADLLGVSRPTLMKWARDQEIASHKVGTHTRFKRADVMALKSKREGERRMAFENLRALDAESLDDFDDE